MCHVTVWFPPYLSTDMSVRPHHFGQYCSIYCFCYVHSFVPDRRVYCFFILQLLNVFVHSDFQRKMSVLTVVCTKEEEEEEKEKKLEVVYFRMVE